MLRDGLYDKPPRPDYVLGQRVAPGKIGAVAIRAGIFMAARDSFKVTILGVGGHGTHTPKKQILVENAEVPTNYRILCR